jgi:hypothetical protein
MDQGSLLCNLNLNDEIYLYCLSCNYKNFIGTSYYDKIVSIVKGVKND